MQRIIFFKGLDQSGPLFKQSWEALEIVIYNSMKTKAKTLNDTESNLTVTENHDFTEWVLELTLIDLVILFKMYRRSNVQRNCTTVFWTVLGQRGLDKWKFMILLCIMHSSSKTVTGSVKKHALLTLTTNSKKLCSICRIQSNEEERSSPEELGCTGWTFLKSLTLSRCQVPISLTFRLCLCLFGQSRAVVFRVEFHLLLAEFLLQLVFVPTVLLPWTRQKHHANGLQF